MELMIVQKKNQSRLLSTLYSKRRHDFRLGLLCSTGLMVVVCQTAADGWGDIQKGAATVSGCLRFHKIGRQSLTRGKVVLSINAEFEASSRYLAESRNLKLEMGTDEM
jgi:hypothetical protein